MTRRTLPHTTPRDLFAGMNKTEAAFAQQLEAQRRTGQIAAWHYEAVTFTLATDCRYTPDFMVIEADGRITFHETKGFWREDAKVKLRVAARLFPFPFHAHVLAKGTWTQQDFTDGLSPNPGATDEL